MIPAPPHNAAYAFDVGDVLSPTWKKLQDWVEARITQLHLHDEKSLPADEHHETRGRILELRALLRLGQRPPSDARNTALNPHEQFNDMSLP